jgi:molecular chaperone GrpE (heat shock protein)
MLFAAIGAGTLYWCKMQARTVEAESARFEAKHSGQTQEFIRKVNEQVTKGDKVKLDLTWLRDEKSPQQRQDEQHERLLGDIERLAAGAEPLYAEVLYGDNWRDEVEKYKTAVYQRDMIQIGAVGVLIAGGLLMCIGLMLVVVAAIRNIWQQGNTQGAAKDDTADQIKAEMKTALADLAGNIEARQKQFITTLSENTGMGMPVAGESVTAKFDESLSRFGKGLQNRLEGLISRIESAYNAGSQRNDEMLNHMNALLKEQGASLEKMTAEMETVASSFMSEFAKLGKGMDERTGRMFQEHSEQLARETETLKKLTRDIEKSISRKPAGSGSGDDLEKALADLRKGIVSDLAAVAPSQGSTEIRELIEKVEAVMAVGPSIDIKGELESTLHDLREGITLDLASLTCKDADTLKELVSKVEAAMAARPDVNITDELNGALRQLREGIAMDLASLTSKDADTLKQLVSKVEAAMAARPDVNITDELNGALSQLREGIAMDLASLTSKDADTLKELADKVGAATAMTSSDRVVQPDLGPALDQLREALASDMTTALSIQADAMKEFAAKVDAIAAQAPAHAGGELEKAVAELKDHVAAEMAAMRQSLPQTPNLDELLSSVRTSDASIAQTTERILSMVEDLSASQAAASELGSMISSSDTVYGDQSLTQAGQETSSAKEIVSATLAKTESIEKNVDEACRQIMAIREYAARQQERMERLQDGYDWNIIGNFCLRVIRCVDNLEDRIAELAIAGQDTRHLQVLRDELLFSMESSGVERFEVDPGSDFRGQEHRLKAQSQREVTTQPELYGKVALVVRPGYQCYISEDATKTVRPAEVRIYGQTAAEEIAIGDSTK